MDKQTLSNYGWLVIVTLILAVMLALATPFGEYVGNGVVSVVNGFIGSSNQAMDDDNIGSMSNIWNEKLNGIYIDMSTVSSTLADNDWSTIQKVVRTGKIAEAGWKVGDTKTLTINGTTKTATIIGIDHDGENTATFMITEVGGIGVRVMNSVSTNIGGWETSEIRTWLNGDVYDSMTDVAPYIKSVTKMTNNIGYNGNSVSDTSDKVFLLSPKEIGVEWQITGHWAMPDYVGMDALNTEGTIYKWFADGGKILDWFWLRSPISNGNNYFFSYDNGNLDCKNADYEDTVCPAFVIG